MNNPNETPIQALQRALHIDATLAEQLVSGQLSCVEEVAYAPYAEFLDASGLAEPQASELRRIAQLYLLNEDSEGLS